VARTIVNKMWREDQCALSECYCSSPSFTVRRRTIRYDVTSTMSMRILAAWMAAVGRDEYNVDEDRGEDYTGGKDNHK